MWRSFLPGDNVANELLGLLAKNVGVPWLGPIKLFLVAAGQSFEGTLVSRQTYMADLREALVGTIDSSEHFPVDPRRNLRDDFKRLTEPTPENDGGWIFLADVKVSGAQTIARARLSTDKVEFCSFIGESPKAS